MPRGDSTVMPDDSSPSRTKARHARDFSLTLDQLIWLAGSICSLRAVAFDPYLVRQRIVPPCTTATLIDVLAELGFETRSGDKLDPGHIAVAALSLGSDARVVPVLVVRVAEDQVDFFHALERRPSALSSDEFARRRTGSLLTVRLQTAPPQDVDAVTTGSHFGFSWFVPELLRHRQIWRDGLLASLWITRL